MVLGVPKAMLVRLGWIALSFGVVQVLRLLNNVILTRLLEPSVFGLMSLVVAIRVGMELVSDVGVTQNIVSNPRGHRPRILRYGLDPPGGARNSSWPALRPAIASSRSRPSSAIPSSP